MQTRMNFMQQQMVLNRKELIDYAIAELGITQDHKDYEDIVSVGMLALVKAATEFEQSEYEYDEFDMYAFERILEAIEQYLVGEEMCEYNVSINASISTDDGEKICFEELISSDIDSLNDKTIYTEFLPIF